MKARPSVTIDERGILLHLTDADGNGVAIPLDPTALVQLSTAVTTALAELKTPRGRSLLVSAAGALFRELTASTEREEERGTSDPERNRKTDR